RPGELHQARILRSRATARARAGAERQLEAMTSRGPLDRKELALIGVVDGHRLGTVPQAERVVQLAHPVGDATAAAKRSEVSRGIVRDLANDEEARRPVARQLEEAVERIAPVANVVARPVALDQP